MATTIQIAEKERVKQIVAEIIRQAGGVLRNKTRLAEAFWRAHLNFSESQPGYLSLWPILKTSAGPVIQQEDVLLGELAAEATLRLDPVQSDGFEAFRLALVDNRVPGEPLATEAVAAIREAVESIDREKSAGGFEPRYQSSRAWKRAADGDEVLINLDLVPEDEYQTRGSEIKRLAEALDAVWK